MNIEPEIIDELRDLWARGKDAGWRDPIWTERLKESFKKLGDRHHLLTLSSQNGGEYLLDVVLCEELDGLHNGIIVAVESEWSPNPTEVKYDFKKLCDTRANFRVMVYSYFRGTDDLPERLHELSRHHRHKRDDDAYLTFGVPVAWEKNFEPAIYRWKVADKKPQQVGRK